MGSERRTLRCAIYTRKSSEHGLEQDFNSLHAQRESAEAYIKSQAHEGWTWAAVQRRGEYADTAEIAGECGLGESYVRRMLRLAYLAPDIVEAIAEGRQPRGLTLERLLSPVSFAWAEQRQRFGFATHV